MKQINLLVIGTIIIITGCANISVNISKNTEPTRCYVLDSTQNITKAEYKNMFAKIEKRESKIGFPECDTSSLPDIKIKPMESFFGKTPTKTSVISLGVDVASVSTGFWLTSATGSYLWLLLGLIQFEPFVRVDYAVRRRNKDGHFQIDTLVVDDQSWFQNENQAKQLILNTSQSDIIGNYFPEDKDFDFEPNKNRISINVNPLLAVDENGGWFIEPHYERFLPHWMAWDISPGEYFPFTSPNGYHDYWIESGPKWYFLWDLAGIKKHSGLFIGIEGYYRDLNDQILEHDLGLPVTFGSVWQGKWLSVSLDLGIGPIYEKFDNNPYGLESHFRAFTLSNISFGYNF